MLHKNKNETNKNFYFSIFQVGGFLFNEKTEWATSRELHGLAALTFNEKECAGVMAVITKALNPRDNTWRTLHKVGVAGCAVLDCAAVFHL